MDTNLDTPLSVPFSYPKREMYIFKCAKFAKSDFCQCLADDTKVSTLGLQAIKTGFLKCIFDRGPYNLSMFYISLGILIRVLTPVKRVGYIETFECVRSVRVYEMCNDCLHMEQRVIS